MAAAVLAVTGCGSDKTKTVTVPGPASTVTVTAPATTPATTTETQPSSGTYRKPKPGEGQVTVTGNVANGETRRLPGTGDTSVYTYFVLQPADGGPALRVGAAGDLNLDPKVRAALVDPRCGGKLRGTFTVAAAPKRETAFDWELVSARLLNNCSRA
jgi:hypothetical protein